MKRWKVNRIVYKGNAPLYTHLSDDESFKLEKYLNKIEQSGWEVEGVEFHSNDKATIISSRAVPPTETQENTS